MTKYFIDYQNGRCEIKIVANLNNGKLMAIAPPLTGNIPSELDWSDVKAEGPYELKWRDFEKEDYDEYSIENEDGKIPQICEVDKYIFISDSEGIGITPITGETEVWWFKYCNREEGLGIAKWIVAEMNEPCSMPIETIFADFGLEHID